MKVWSNKLCIPTLSIYYMMSKPSGSVCPGVSCPVAFMRQLRAAAATGVRSSHLYNHSPKEVSTISLFLSGFSLYILPKLFIPAKNVFMMMRIQAFQCFPCIFRAINNTWKFSSPTIAVPFWYC